MSESYFKRLLRDFSHRSRTKKFELLESVFHPQPGDRVLDIGASGEVFLRYTFEDVYPYPERVVAGGYEWNEVASARRYYPQCTYTVFDGCRLPFPDQSFDLVFSNAVIEHILGTGRQQQFAREIMRVGKSWFVTTPNYWYPFESHYHLPFIQSRSGIRWADCRRRRMRMESLFSNHVKYDVGNGNGGSGIQWEERLICRSYSCLVC